MSENVKNDNTNKCTCCMAPANYKCSRCQLVLYCNEDCQKKHWEEGHKNSCFSPEDRKASKQPDSIAAEESENFEECCICLDSLSEGTQTLDCGHTFHKSCISELRKKSVQQVCPLCRAELDTPETMFEEMFEIGNELFSKIEKDLEMSNKSWKNLFFFQEIIIIKVIKLWTKCAYQGYTGAQYNLGLMYDKGQGVAQDDSAAMKWYRMAADQGHAGAQYNLGVMYRQGRGGLSQSDALAVQLYRKAADQGFAPAQYILGNMYSKGKGGLSQSDVIAAKLFRKAADQGHANAQYNLGLKYFCGKGVPQSDVIAVQLWHKAAEQGHAKVQDYLGIMYEMGQKVPQNILIAKEWYQKAADRGNSHAANKLKRMADNDCIANRTRKRMKQTN